MMGMQPWVVLAILVVFLVSRPVEARLWRAGRLSDRATTLLILGRMPILVLVVSILNGVEVLLTAGLLALTVFPVALFYRFFMNLLAEQRTEWETEASRRVKG